ncbi:unnamed protein product, partial [Litomosoides sigmodontis]
ILLQKIHRQLPDFNDVLATYDKHGSENIVATDGEFRQLVLLHGKGRLKMYTVRRCSHAQPFRSHSVPHNIARLKQLPLRSTSCLRGPPPSYREIKWDENERMTCEKVPSFCSDYAYSNRSNAIGIDSGSRRYGQTLIHGYPPQSFMMHSFLCSPFPFGGRHRNSTKTFKFK